MDTFHKTYKGLYAYTVHSLCSLCNRVWYSCYNSTYCHSSKIKIINNALNFLKSSYIRRITCTDDHMTPVLCVFCTHAYVCMVSVALTYITLRTLAPAVELTLD